MMHLTHIFSRVTCQWTWRWLTTSQWNALPHIVVLSLACGGSSGSPHAMPLPVVPIGRVAIPAPIPVQPPVDLPYLPPPSVLVYLPPAPVDLRPAIVVADNFGSVFRQNDTMIIDNKFKILPWIDIIEEEQRNNDHGRDTNNDHGDEHGGDHIPEPGPLSVLGVALMAIGVIRFIRNV